MRMLHRRGPGTDSGGTGAARSARLPVNLAFRSLMVMALAVPVVAVGAPSAHAATNCDAFTTEIQQVVNPRSAASLDTPWAGEADNAEAKYGFTEQVGVAYLGSLSSTNLVAMHRLYNPSTNDFTVSPRGEAMDELISAGYQDQGKRFYATTDAGNDCVAVSRFTRGSDTRLVAPGSRQQALLDAGWTKGPTVFYAASPKQVLEPAPATSNTKFSIAVMPDTQAMTNVGDPRFGNITKWLVDNRASLDLRYVGHSGDVTNWGWLAPSQYEVAKDAMATVERAGLPYSLPIGNHDTRAVGWNGVSGSTGYGGGAYMYNPECVERLGASQCRSDLLVRQTQEFNAAFKAERYRNVGGAFEANKVDNIWTSFEAGGKKFLVLNIELWPRQAAVEWAKEVVATHPEHNVIIQTHHYLDGNGSISGSSGGYGTTSPQYLYDNLVKVYPNVKMVFSGHAGAAATRTDVGQNGNTVYSFLQNSPGGVNPVRLVEIDTENGTMSTRIYSPDNNETLSGYSQTFTGVKFV